MSDDVRELALERIMDLRVRVLRKGTPVSHCNYPEDDYPDVVHFGIERNGLVIATSTWFMKACTEAPGKGAMQLKGMAVDESLQGSGLGAVLIRAGLAHARSRGAEIVWARARDSALGFYERLDFAAVGAGFIDEPTGMPHHIVVRPV